MRWYRLVPIIGLMMLSAGCDGDDAATTPTAGSTTVVGTSTTAPSTTTPSASTSVATTTAPSTPNPPVTTAPQSTTTTTATTTPVTTPASTPASTVDVRLYLLRGERLAITHREVDGPAVLASSIKALLAGPTSGEATAGLLSNIPTGTRLLGVNLVDGTATIDLSNDFERGGGTLSMTTRIAEVVFTATQFANVDRVVFWLDGAPIEFLGGEGIVMTDPWTRSDVGYDISGSVLIDTPTPGATVRSPFVVTGEGDVYEAQFPIEVWRDGVQIGGMAPVTAGAWGEWVDFEVTLTVEATPGPIELVAYDEGGCGDDPECPEIIRTVVPLELVD